MAPVLSWVVLQILLDESFLRAASARLSIVGNLL